MKHGVDKDTEYFLLCVTIIEFHNKQKFILEKTVDQETNRKIGNKRAIGMELTKMLHFPCVTIIEFHTNQKLRLEKSVDAREIQQKSETKNARKK